MLLAKLLGRGSAPRTVVTQMTARALSTSHTTDSRRSFSEQTQTINGFENHHHSPEWGLYDSPAPTMPQHAPARASKTAPKTPMISPLYGETPRTSLLMELTDRVGILHEVLRYFWKYDVNISRIGTKDCHFFDQTLCHILTCLFMLFDDVIGDLK